MRSYREYRNAKEGELRPIERFMRYALMDPQKFEAILNANINLVGYGMDEYAYTEFAVEYTPDDEEYFGDSGMQVSVYPPVSVEERHQLMSLDEYYAYLEDYANCYLANKSQEEKQRVYAKLAKVKEAFRHAK